MSCDVTLTVTVSGRRWPSATPEEVQELGPGKAVWLVPCGDEKLNPWPLAFGAGGTREGFEQGSNRLVWVIPGPLG